MLRLALFASLLAGTALAEPGYFRVTDVASDDTLNVRALPDAHSEDIGDLAHDQTAVEVIDTDGYYVERARIFSPDCPLMAYAASPEKNPSG